MLQLYGRVNSSNVQTVLIALHELNLPFERHDVGMQFGVNNTPEYLRRNPNGLIPLLADDAVDVWESNTILRYLAQKYGPTPLYPTELVARSHVERWMDWRQTTLGPSAGFVFVHHYRLPPEKRDINVLRAKELDGIRNMKILDAQLEGKRFVTGDTFTMADITLFVTAHRYFILPFEAQRPELPNATRWIEQLRARASVKTYAQMAIT
jgi:glutathione S-transferase